MRFEVLTAARLTVHVFRDVTFVVGCVVPDISREQSAFETSVPTHPKGQLQVSEDTHLHYSTYQFIRGLHYYPFCAAPLQYAILSFTLLSFRTLHILTFGRPIHVPLIEFTITKRRLRFTVTIFHIHYTINS